MSASPITIPAEQIPGMPTDAELRTAILVPPIGRIAINPVAIESDFQSDQVTDTTMAVVENQPARRRAFGSVPNLIKVAVDPSIVVTDQDTALIQPSYLKGALYAKQGKKVVDGLAYNPREHATFIFSMGTFLERVSDSAETKYANENGFLKREHVLGRKIDSLEGKLAKHEALQESLRGQWTQVHELRAYAHRPGYALTDEAHLRMLATQIWVGPIKDMLGVVAQEKMWTEAQSKAANEALLRALLYGPQRNRIQNWQILLGITENYVTDKGITVGGRRNSIDLRLKSLKAELHDMYEQTGYVPR